MSSLTCRTDFPAAHYALSIAYGRLGDPAGQGEELLRYGRGSAGNPPLVDALLAKVRELDRGFLYYSNQGTKFINAGQNSEAAAALEKALEIEPNHALSHIHLITAYGQLGLFDRAARHFQDAIRLEPGRTDAYFTYGAMLYNQRRVTEAEATFRKAIELDPGSPEALFGLAKIDEKQGRLEEGRKHCEMAVESEPDFAPAYTLLGPCWRA
jgi:tetratricopeptide (TPR) repeat protein